MQKVPCDIICVVWGDEYIHLFLEYGLVSHLSQKNREGLNQFFDATYVIYCYPEDKNKIISSSTFQNLEQEFTFEFRFIKKIESENKYSLMAKNHRDAVEKAYRKKGALIFLAPDNIVTKESLYYLSKIAVSGKTLVLSPGIRVSTSLWKRNVLHDLPKFATNFENYSDQEILNCCRKSLHSSVMNRFWHNEKIGWWTSHFYWKLDEKSFLVRGFHLHPLFMKPTKLVEDNSTLDDTFLAKCCPNPKQWHIMNCSKDFVHFDITPDEDQQDVYLRKKSYFWISNWTFQHTYKHHKSFVLHPFIFQCSPSNKSWDIVLKESEKMIKKLLWWDKLQFFFFYPVKIGSFFKRAFRKCQSLLTKELKRSLNFSGKK